jgi:DNA-directed RNA polymerase II subunit RPB2
MAGSLLATHFR